MHRVTSLLVASLIALSFACEGGEGPPPDPAGETPSVGSTLSSTTPPAAATSEALATQTPAEATAEVEFMTLEPPRARYVAAGGVGVALRGECNGSPLAGGGWPDGTLVSVTYEGVGRCKGWSIAEVDGAPSWVSDTYLVATAPSTPSPTPAPPVVATSVPPATPSTGPTAAATQQPTPVATAVPTPTPPIATPTPVPPAATVAPQVAIETCIASDFEGWSGDTLFELCNGQVWIQTSFAYRYHYAYRPNVTIVVTAGGGYRMSVEGIDDSIGVAQVSQFIKSCISSEFDGFEYGEVFVLCNGQVWEQTSGTFRFHYAFRPDVIIYQAPSGGVRMKVEGIDDSISVTRVQ